MLTHAALHTPPPKPNPAPILPHSANQLALLERLRVEQDKMGELPQSEVTAMLADVPAYTQRLQAMQHEMAALTERMNKLQQRSESLVQRKIAQDEEDARRQQKERERDMALAAKMVIPETDNAPSAAPAKK